MRACLISEEIITAGAASQEEEPTNCDPRNIQPTDVTPQQREISDLAPREAETVGCDSPLETESVSLAPCETESEIADPAGCQEPEAACLAPHETAPQDPEIADPAADETADASHCDITNVNSLTIADPPLPKLSTAEVEPSKAETADLDALGTKITDPTPLQEPRVTNVDHHETTEIIPPKTADPLLEPQAAHSDPQDNRRSNSEEAGHSRVLARLTRHGNSGHSPTDTSPALLGSLGDTNENPIVLDDSTAGDSRFNPIEYCQTSLGKGGKG